MTSLIERLFEIFF